jgi:hypothetical protein
MRQEPRRERSGTGHDDSCPANGVHAGFSMPAICVLLDPTRVSIAQVCTGQLLCHAACARSAEKLGSQAACKNSEVRLKNSVELLQAKAPSANFIRANELRKLI